MNDERTKYFHIGNFMDLCHLAKAKCARRLRTYEGRVVFREDNVQDDCGYRALRAEQINSASQMAETKFADTHKILRITGEASHAETAHSPEFWIRIPRQRLLTRDIL